MSTLVPGRAKPRTAPSHPLSHWNTTATPSALKNAIFSSGFSRSGLGIARAAGRDGAMTVCSILRSSSSARRGTPFASAARSIATGGVASTAIPFSFPRYFSRSCFACRSTMTAFATVLPAVPGVLASG